MPTQEEVTLQQILNQLNDEQGKFLKYKLDLKTQLKGLDADELAAAQAVGDMRKLERQAVFETVQLREELATLLEEEKAYGSELGEQESDRIDALKEQLKIGKDINITADELRDSNKEDEKSLKRRVKYGEKYDNVWGGIATKIGIGNSSMLKGVNNVITMGTELANNEEKMQEFVTSGKRMFSLANIGFKILENTIAMALAVDKARAGFAAATGTGYEYQRTLVDLNKEGLNMELNMERVVQGLTAVRQELIGGADQSKEFQKNLSLQIGQFDKLGIKSSEVVGIMNDLQATMGVTSANAIELTKDIALSATQMGIAPSKMAADFRKASSQIAVHGSKSIDVFKGLAVAARNAGTSVDSLLSIASKFDTFESAVDSAGKLNAILGTTMSATDMLRGTEEERIEGLIKTVQSTGVQFNQMDRFKQKAIAQAAGISDMAEANRIFGMSLGAYKQQQKDAEASARVQKGWNDTLSATLPIQEKLQMALQKLAANGATVDAIIGAMTKGVEILTAAFEFLSGPVGTFIMYTAIITKVLGSIPILSTMATGAIQAFGASFLTAGAEVQVGSGMASGGVALLAASSSASAGPILALGFAMLLLGGGIALALLGFAGLVLAFGQLEGGQILGAVVGIYALSSSIVAMVAALAAMANPMTAAGAGIFSTVALAIGGAAAGVGVLLAGMAALAGLMQPVTNAGTGAVDAAMGIKKMAETLKSAPANFDMTLENLALITAGKSAGLTGTANATSDLVNNIKNVIKNEIDLTVEISGGALETYIIETMNNYKDEGGG